MCVCDLACKKPSLSVEKLTMNSRIKIVYLFQHCFIITYGSYMFTLTINTDFLPQLQNLINGWRS